MATKLVFTLEGDRSDLDFLSSRVDGAIDELIADAQDEGRLDDTVELYREWDDA